MPAGLPRQAVATRAAALGEDTLAARRIARLFEEARGIEVREQIGRGLFVDIRPARHSRAPMALHMAGAWFHMVAASDGGREVAVGQTAKIGRARAAAPVHAVALRAGESGEELAPPRVESAVKTGVCACAAERRRASSSGSMRVLIA